MTPFVTPADAVALSLVFTRIIAILMSFPFINTTLIPRNVKILLLIALSFFITKTMHPTIALDDFSMMQYILSLLRELMIGFGLGLVANFFISAFSYAAEIISYFMGITVANIFDPTYGQVSILSKLFIFLFYMIFFVSGAYEYFISVLFMSFHYYPIDSDGFHQGFWRYIIQNSLTMFTLAFQLAFPFALILYLINLSLALVNRMIPQINVFIVGLPLQIFVGLAALAAGASLLVLSGVHYVQRMSEEIFYLIKHIGL